MRHHWLFPRAVFGFLFTLAILASLAAQTAGGAISQLSVEEAEGLAEAHSRELSIEKLEMQKASAGLREARARRGPSLSFRGSGSFLSNPTEGIAITKGAFGYSPTAQSEAPVAIPDQDFILLEDAEHSYFQLKATLTQPIFAWGKLLAAVRAAELELSVAGHDLETTQAKVRGDTRRAYFGMKLGRGSLAILDRAVDIAEAIVNDREHSFSEGLITRQDVLETVSQQAQLIAQQARAAESIWAATAALELLTGAGFENVSLGSDYRSSLPELVEDELIERAIQSSPERALLLSRVDQASAIVDLRRGSRLFRPDFSLNISLDVTGQRVPIIGANWRESWDTNLIITVGTSMNVFDSGTAASKVEQAETDLLIAGEGLAALEDGIQLQVRTAIYSVDAAWSELHQTKAGLDLAAEKERNASVAYENELITRREALAAQIGLMASELAYYVAGYAFEMTLTEVEGLTGISIPGDG